MSLIERAINRLDSEQAARDENHGRSPEPPAYTPSLDSDPVPEITDEVAHTDVHSSVGARRGRSVAIATDALAKQGYLVPGVAEGALREEFRRIKRALLLGAHHPSRGARAESRENVIVVTSAVPNEGKTFVSINLALSVCTEVDQTVLLVDGDGRQSAIQRVLGIDADVGLLDVLEGKCDLSDVILRTNFHTLSVIPAGPPRDGSDELIASDKMSKIMQEVAGRYSDRVVIVDTPPVLAATEGAVLARYARSLLLVVRADSTTHRDVTACLQELGQHDGIAMVLNGASRFVGDSPAYYEYYR